MLDTRTMHEDVRDIGEGDVVVAAVAAVAGDAVRLEHEGTSYPLVAAELPQASQLTLGQRVDVFLDRDTRTGELCASLVKAGALRLWDELTAAAECGAELEGEVIAVVKGGLSLDLGMRAFLPASQVSLRPTSELAPLVGQRLRVRVLELDKKRGSLIVSHRAVLEAQRAKVKARQLDTLHPGDLVTGTVKTFVPYGAFIDLGGLEGLLRLEDLSWGHVRHASQLLSVGQEVTVRVLELQRDKERVALGLKQLTDDPWQSVPKKYPVGSRVRVRVLRLADFGAFVELEPNVEGLVHVSEMSWGRAVRHPGDVVQPGAVVEAQVLDLDPKERKIGLGLRQLTPNPWRSLRETHRPGARLSGTVSSVTDFGAFVTLEGGVDGLVHASDMSWTERVRPADRFEKGDRVEVVLLDVDVQNERVALGVKQLTEDPWSAAGQLLRRGNKVSGRVTRLADFGAFLELAPGVEGLCHISELTEDRDKRPHEVTKVGATLTVQVLDVDPESRRIALSLLAVENAASSYRQHMQDKGKFGNSLGDKLAKKLGPKP